MTHDGVVSTSTPRILAQVQGEPLSLDAAVAAVRDRRAGGVVAFIGTVREHDGGRDGVTTLTYSAHPQAEQTLRAVAGRVAALPGVCGVAAVHREGELEVGDLAVLCVVSAEHRAEAFAGARQLIEELKAQVPIWKDQAFADGEHEWVGL